MASWRDEKKGDFKLPPASPTPKAEDPPESRHGDGSGPALPTSAMEDGGPAQTSTSEQVESLKSAFEEQRKRLEELQVLSKDLNVASAKDAAEPEQEKPASKPSPRRPISWIVALAVLSVVAATLLALVAQSTSNLQELSKRSHRERMNLKQLEATNQQLSASNKILTARQEGLQVEVNRLEGAILRLSSTNDVLISRMKMLTEALSKREWTEFLETEIQRVLAGKNNGMKKSDVLSHVKKEFPVTEDFLYKTLEGLVQKREVEVKRVTFGDDVYFPRGALP
jgi:hypothetical protein